MSDVSNAEAEPPEVGAPPSPFALPPISADDPCGPDLDLEGDPDYLNFFAATEGLLPTNYYSFSRETIEFPAAFKTIEGLLERTLDVRLLILGAKLSILNRDLEGFASRVGSVAWLLETYWDEAHPRAEGSDFGLRVGQLETLEDGAVVLLPLQYAPLMEATRQGSLSYRDHLVATGAAQPRVVTRLNLQGQEEISADEKFMAPNVIDRVLRDVEIEKLVKAYETARGLAASVEVVRTTTKARGAGKATVKLEKLDEIAKGMAEFLRAAVVARDPSLAPGAESGEAQTAEGGAQDAEGAAAAPAVPSAFATLADVDSALSSALGYFLRAEPTSPAVLLIRQARQTLGKNLYEVMQLLAPEAADEARVFVGPDGAFPVPVRNLSDAPTEGGEPVETEPAASRHAAIATIDQVVQHMQKTQPSSPIPYLLERAKALATRDFVSLLNDILSEDSVAKLKRRD
ncbi:ImpA family type VI secretion system protein [Roseiarcus sp.]|uniref:type VI secretion system protein TssA n=1 Tax=Roseiarcus sp. TaxID=1969460 RepID=UPI003F98AF7B